MPVCTFFTIFSRISNGTLATARVVSYFGADSSILTRFLSAWARCGVTRNHKLDIFILLFAWLWYLTSNQESVPGWQKYSLYAQVKNDDSLFISCDYLSVLNTIRSACSWRPKNISSKKHYRTWKWLLAELTVVTHVPISQLPPEYPEAHLQVYESFLFAVQTPPFRQGLLSHGPTAVEQQLQKNTQLSTSILF